MKTTVFIHLSTLLFSLSFTPVALAKPGPVAASCTGYWNVETNLAAPRQSLGRYYNGQHQLVHEENLGGRHLNQRRGLRRRTVRHLNLMLQRVLQTPQPAPEAPAALAPLPADPFRT